MSHFVVGVIVSYEHYSPDEELEPFSENLEVEKYPVECYCVNDHAQTYAYEQVKEAIGDLEARRKLFDKLSYVMSYREEHKEHWMEREHMDVLNAWWKEFNEEWLAERDRLQQQFMKEHPLYMLPLPDCEDCEGTGTRQSTYNPDSQWDWWEIGGRWEGDLPNKSNYIQISDLLALPDEDLYFPWALLTEGEWIEKGSMGWFGMSHGEKEEDEWHEVVREIYTRHADQWLCIVDCHI